LQKELTRIPNRVNALKYQECLIKALEEGRINWQTEVKENYEGQYSEIVVSVDNGHHERASEIMKLVIKKGPPNE